MTIHDWCADWYNYKVGGVTPDELRKLELHALRISARETSCKILPVAQLFVFSEAKKIALVLAFS